METKHELYLVLGCFGRREDDFISCAGIENAILHIEEGLYLYNDMMEYLDNCRLFDRPIFDLNAIRHFVFNMRERYDQPMRRLWSEKKFDLYQKFIIEHRHCGLYVKLVLTDPIFVAQQPEEKSILIPGEKSDSNDSEPIKGKLRIVRGTQTKT